MATKKKNGRPKLAEKKGIDFGNPKEKNLLITYLELSLTKEEIAQIYGVSISTLRRILEEQLSESFETLQNKHSVNLKARARRNLIRLSDNGDTSATIYLNKITGALEESQKQNIELRKRELDLKEMEINKNDGHNEKQGKLFEAMISEIKGE